jgi:hypothetical protein
MFAAMVRLLGHAWRALFVRTPPLRVLAIGDSHIRVFEHWYFLATLPRVRFEVVYVAGATAGGIRNPQSVTEAGRIFRAAIDRHRPDLVVVHLGEVDTAYTIWKRAERHGQNPRWMMKMAVERYWEFLQELHAERPLVVLGACLPTLADQAAPGDDVASTRSGVQASQQDRTALTLAFNAQVAERCSAAGIPFWDSSSVALGPDGVVRDEWTNRPRHDHHYARKPFARWLVAQLRSYRPQHEPGRVDAGLATRRE